MKLKIYWEILILILFKKIKIDNTKFDSGKHYKSSSIPILQTLEILFYACRKLKSAMNRNLVDEKGKHH